MNAKLIPAVEITAAHRTSPATSVSPVDASYPPRFTYLLPGGIVFVVVLAMLLHGPIYQLADYHHFADQRAWLGVPNAADVLSNIAFLFAGMFGLNLMRTQRDNAALALGKTGYGLFFIALLLTACGSTWYHLEPDNARLVFDRLPIALACAGLMSAVWSESVGGSRALTPALAIFGALSVTWWRYTDLLGAGDLRPYLLLQLLPLVLIPVLQWQHSAPRSDRLAFAVMIALYALAKVCELADHSTFAALSLISGHTIKHLAAALAAAVVAWNLARRVKA